MASKKGDISLNTIIYAAIAVLVLVLIVALVTKGFGLFQRDVGRYGEELDSIKQECKIDCQETRTNSQSIGINEWLSSSYCTEPRGYDRDGSGQIGDADKEFIYCWEEPINVDCSVILSTGGAKGTVGEVDPDTNICISRIRKTRRRICRYNT